MTGDDITRLLAEQAQRVQREELRKEERVSMRARRYFDLPSTVAPSVASSVPPGFEGSDRASRGGARGDVAGRSPTQVALPPPPSLQRERSEERVRLLDAAPA